MFEQGDRVKSEWTSNLGKVLYGPFVPAAEHYKGEESYLVELLEGQRKGMTGIWPTKVMSRGPKFELGQKVTFTYSPVSEVFEVAAGPFPGDEGQPLYVLKDKDGVHDTSWEKHMVPVE
jgi:hypothetical protein